MKACRECGQQVWLTKNVAEVRKVYPKQELDYLCKTCKQKQVDALVDRTRKELGLAPRSTS